MGGEVTFGQWLRQARKARDLTQEQLAFRVNYSWDTIRKLESGARRPSRELVESLADFFQVPHEERPRLVHFARVGHDHVEATLPYRTNGTAPHVEHHPPNNLPAERSTFIGRESEVVQLLTLLKRDDVRLLTLVGPPGIGKTRLSMKVARAAFDGFESGVFLVSLAPITDARLVPHTIAQALGVQEPAGKVVVDALKEYLAGKEMLLVLDNFEQVLGAAPVVGQLLEAAPQVKVLVTSRTPLHLYGEHEFAVPPLSMPDPGDKVTGAPERLAQYEAVALFVDRSKAVDPLFSFEKNAAIVLDICRRLDGIPLAIELAAARSKVLAPGAMLARLSSRLKLLTTGQQDLPPRHQTLRAAIAWSYDLMEEAEQALFRRMGVFVGGCTLEAFVQVCSAPDANLQEFDPVEGVASLMDRSLLMRVETPNAELRFTMLETIREYALEILAQSGEEESARRSHATFFLGLAEYAEPELRGPNQAAWLRRLEEEHNNLRAALEWSKATEVGTMTRLAAALWRYWNVHGHLSEGRRWLELATEIDSAEATLIRAKVRYGVGVLRLNLGEYDQASKCFGESLDLYRSIGDTYGTANSLDNLGVLASFMGDYGSAVKLFNQSLVIRRELGDKHSIAVSLNNLAYLATDQGNYAQAYSLTDEALALLRELGEQKHIAISLNHLGRLARIRGDYSRARGLHEESLMIMRDLGNKEGIASSLNSLGEVARQCGDYEAAYLFLEQGLAIFSNMGEKIGITMLLNSLGHLARSQGDCRAARQYYNESLAMLIDLEDKHGTALCLAGLAQVRYMEGQLKGSAILSAAVEVILEATGITLEPSLCSEYERTIAATQERLGKEEFQEAWAIGRVLTLEEAVAEAIK